MSSRTSLVWALVLTVAVLGNARALAQARSTESELLITTREHGSWPDTVAALQRDLGAEGRRIHVVVSDRSSHVAACGRYALALDAAGTRAFAVGPCDPRTQATELELVSRTDLFAHDGAVPQPLSIVLAATELRVGADSGGAALTGGAALECSIGVRPYLDDLEHGTVVYLDPGHYDIRPDEVNVVVVMLADGWTLHARALAAVTIGYSVVDRTTGAIVLRDHATLACGDAVPTEPAATVAVVADHVLVLEGTELSRPAEVVAILDVDEASGDEGAALALLRLRAAEAGADAVVDVQLRRGRGSRGSIHLSGLAVRYLGAAR